MQKIIKYFKNPINVIFLVLFLIGAWLRLNKIGTFITADEPHWFIRSITFIHSFINKNFLGMEQTPHPGVPTMWIASIGYSIYKFFLSKYNELGMVFLMRLPFGLISVTSVAIVYYLLIKLFNYKLALLTTLLFSISPLFLGHSQIVHIDLVLSLFLPFSFILFLLYLKFKNKIYFLFSTISYALALLSKTPAFIVFPIFIIPLYLIEKNKIKFFKKIITFYILTIVFMVIFWPALLINPLLYIKDIYKSLFNSAISIHTATNIGDYESDWPYYFIHITQYSTYVSTFISFTAIFGFFSYIKKIKFNIDFISLITLFLYSILFFFVMTISAKKGERYMMPIYIPLMIIISYMSLQFINKIKFKILQKLFLLLLSIIYLFNIYNLINISPYYFAYYNKIFTPNPNIIKRGWGEGLELAAEYLNNKPNGNKLTVAPWYGAVFEKYFKGNTVALDSWFENQTNYNVNYVVLYKGMHGRPIDNIATKMLEQFKNKKPEKIFLINNLPYVWIYKIN